MKDKYNSSLVYGRKGTGKSSLAKIIVEQTTLNDLPYPIVYDPQRGRGWNTPYVFNDIEDWKKEVYSWGRPRDQFSEPRRLAVIDEGRREVGHWDDEMIDIVAEQRHFGLVIILISQRMTELSKTARDQSDKLFLFSCHIDDCEILARDFHVKELIHAHTLPELHFYETARGGPASVRKIDFRT